MKSLFLVLCFLSLNLKAQTSPDIDNAEDYRWLYELLLSPNSRIQSPDESFKSFQVHLKDSYKTFPRPNEIKNDNLLQFKNSVFVTGTIKYAGIVQKPYKMDVVQRTAGLEINTRIYFKNATATDLVDMKNKIALAEKSWNDARIQTDFPYYFKFDLVTDPILAHYSLNLLDDTRGPYDTQWSRRWTDTTIAHEIGHMLGLGDEYQTISGKVDCLQASLMCESRSGELMTHHYYFVLRRLIKKSY